MKYSVGYSVASFRIRARTVLDTVINDDMSAYHFTIFISHYSNNVILPTDHS